MMVSPKEIDPVALDFCGVVARMATPSLPALASQMKRPSLLLLALCACAALLPPVVLHADVQRLFWFGDEWYLLDGIDRVAFWRWLTLPFAENFCPLFKLLWGGAVLASGGSYAFMLALCWLAHACNVFLFGLLLRRAGLGNLAVALALLVFGLTPTNLETLGWSVQWSAVLSCSFLLLATLLLLDVADTWSPLRLVLLSAAVLASALSFSRGILTGAVLCVLCLPRLGLDGLAASRRVALICALLLPALATAAATVAIGAPSRPQGLLPASADDWMRAAKFGGALLLLNPFVLLAGNAFFHGALVALPVLTKVTLVVAGLRISSGRTRAVLVFLLFLDLGNATLVALGRYWTPLPAAISLRYQYVPLLCSLPAAGLIIERYGRRYAPLLVAAATLFVIVRWPAKLEEWARERGSRTRRLLEGREVRSAPPNIPDLPALSAQQIAARFHLH
jgi:hypothetical protein